MSKEADTTTELDIFQSFDENCRITKECVLDGKKYVELRTKFRPEFCLEDTTTWIKNYSMTTKTNWIVQRTYKDPQRYLFRKDFVCQHSSKNKISHEYFKKRDKGCTVKICIWVRMETANTRRIDKLMRVGLNTTIKISGSHTHEIHVAEIYSCLRVNDETQKLFINYFENGLGPAESKMHHENNLIVGHNENDISKILSNGQINPTDRHVYYIYDNWKKNHNGNETTHSTITTLKKNMQKYKKKGAAVSVSETPMSVSIVTPVMQRAHDCEFAADTVFVESVASRKEGGPTITFFIAANKIGGIPLGCVIHIGQSEEDYRHAFNELKTLIGLRGFGGKDEPKVFLTDDSTAERTALSKTFKSSKLFLSPFHVFQVVWSWLWDEGHSISRCDRKSLMFIVRQILYKKDAASCNAQIEVALQSDLVVKYPLFKKFLKGLVRRKTEWCVAYRGDCVTSNRDTNSVVECSVRVFKDVVLKRCEFNAVALTEFVINIVETHYMRHLQKYASYRDPKHELEFRKFCTEANNLNVENVDYSLFHVTSTTNKNKVYTVHSDLTLCECTDGISGLFCRHLCAVHIKYGTQIIMFPLLSVEDKIMFARIAFGSDVDETFFQKMASAEEPNEGASSSTEVADFLVPVVQIKEMDVDELEMDDDDLPMDDDEVLKDCSESDAEDDVKEIVRLSNNFDTLMNLVKSNYNTYMDETLRKFNDSLENIRTPSQLVDFFKTCSTSCSNTEKKIKVQPSEISRRTSVYKGSIPLKTDQTTGVKKEKSKKRPRTLIDDIFGKTLHAKALT